MLYYMRAMVMMFKDNMENDKSKGKSQNNEQKKQGIETFEENI